MLFYIVVIALIVSLIVFSHSAIQLSTADGVITNRGRVINCLIISLMCSGISLFAVVYLFFVL
ncbi:hypothetical protein PP175_28080 (plasmid) [Aneurinibacillus sp. Ricciae_BoGa-3]|uniref:hypothetical protein n=1 Tax=Aneurinibacillus sp. Ricciae_BoGa-3 TaxID=3022697 RepID=UPI00234014F4|nr:hypothetical protein [Aneurinibacillus sp. Ricciae_BoGa-3]WCK57050.1 hypothetical protein PP175_28080 [Aneurinibacillus sp. Ricciae_BoGa-3]